MNTLWALLWMELKLQLRQPAAVLLLLGLPLLLGPGAMLAGEQWTRSTEEATQGSPDDDEVLRVAAGEPFASWVTEGDQLEVVPQGRVTDDATLDDDEVWASVTLDGREVTITRDHQLAKARQVRKRVRAVVMRQSRAERDAAMLSVGLVPDEEVWKLHDVGHDAAAAEGGRDLGKLLPPLLMFTLLLGAVYTAFDVITGDKERRTSETLLTTGAPRTAVLAAKAAVVAGSAVLAGTAWVIGVVAAHQLGIMGSGDGLQQALGALSPGTVLLVEGLVVLLGLQVAGAAIGVASWVDDYRSGSMVAGPVLLTLLAPSGLPMIDSLELSWWVVAVPVGNVSVAFRDALAGELTGLGGSAVVLVSLLQAFGAFALGHRLLSREETFTGTADADGRRGMGRFGPDAALTFVVTMLVFWFLGTLAQRVNLVGGHLFSQGLFAAMGVGAVAFFGAPWSRLRLVRPRMGDALASVGAGVCTSLLAGVLFLLQESILPGGMRFGELFGESLGEITESLPWVLLLFAVLPGVCEELLFRGGLMGLMERDVPPVPRVLCVAVAFAVMHLSAYRLVPTFFVGCVAGALVLRGRSLWCGILLHVTHNAATFSWPHIVDVETRDLLPRDLVGAGVLAVVLTGLVALVGRRRSE